MINYKSKKLAFVCFVIGILISGIIRLLGDHFGLSGKLEFEAIHFFLVAPFWAVFVWNIGVLIQEKGSIFGKLLCLVAKLLVPIGAVLFLVALMMILTALLS